MERYHYDIRGGTHYLSVAKNIARKLRASKLNFASQTVNTGDATIKVRIVSADTYISIEGDDPIYQFFTTAGKVPSYGTADALHLFPGNFVGLKADLKRKTVVPVALGSTQLIDDVDPPRWVYKADPNEGEKLFPYQIMQLQAIPEHTFFPDAKATRLIHDCWTSPIETAFFSDGQSVVSENLPIRDLGYDSSVAMFAAPGPPAGRGYAPDTDWYRRAAYTRVKSEEFGERGFYLLTDTSGVLHVFHTSVVDQSLREDYQYGWQQIKTNIPSSSSVATKIPYPANTRSLSTDSARDRFNETGTYPWHVAQRWEFNSQGTKMVSVVFIDIPPTVNGEARHEPEFSNREIYGRETTFGFLELDIEVKITGPELTDFEVTLNVARTSASNETVTACGYYWGDIPDIHPPTGVERDELVYIAMDVYHKTKDSASTVAPMYEESVETASVKVWGGRTLRKICVKHETAPLGMVGSPMQKSACKLRYQELSYNISVIRSAAFTLSGGATAEQRALFNDYATDFENTCTALLEQEQSSTEAYALIEDAFQDFVTHVFDLAQNDDYVSLKIKKSLADACKSVSFTMGGNIQTTQYRCTLLAYDLRILGFAFQRSYFINTPIDTYTYVVGETQRQDTLEVIVRNETEVAPAPLSGAFTGLDEKYANPEELKVGFELVLLSEKKSPSSSLRAFQIINKNGLLQTDLPIPSIRTDATGSVAIGAIAYEYAVNEFMAGGAYDIFCVHPHGHWSIGTGVLVYYTKKAKFFMPGRYNPGEMDMNLQSADFDPAGFCSLGIDKINVVEKSGSSKYTHQELFNEAFKKGVDFNQEFLESSVFSIRPVLDIGGEIRCVELVNEKTFLSTFLAFRGSLVIYSTPISFIDARNLSLGGFALDTPRLTTSQLTVPRDRLEFYTQVNRGACLFTSRRKVQV